MLTANDFGENGDGYKLIEALRRERIEWDRQGFFTFAEYEAAARQTMRPDTPRDLQLNAALGVAGEAGEIADTIKKHIYHGKPLDRTALAVEIGDLLWYLAEMSFVLDIPLAVCARLNIAKLRTRFAGNGGRFTEALAAAQADKIIFDANGACNYASAMEYAVFPEDED